MHCYIRISEITIQLVACIHRSNPVQQHCCWCSTNVVPGCCCTCYSIRLTTRHRASVPARHTLDAARAPACRLIHKRLCLPGLHMTDMRTSAYAETPPPPLSAFIRIQLHPPPPFLRTSFMDDPNGCGSSYSGTPSLLWSHDIMAFYIYKSIYYSCCCCCARKHFWIFSDQWLVVGTLLLSSVTV